MNDFIRVGETLLGLNMKYSDFSLKSVKTFVGMEGGGFNATLMLNKTKVGFIINEGCGGETFIQYDEAKHRDTVREFLISQEAKELTDKWYNDLNKEYAGTPIEAPKHMPEDLLLDLLIADYEYMKDAKKLIKKYGLVFRNKGSKEQFRYFVWPGKKSWSKKDFEAMLAKAKSEPDVVIVNEELDIYPVGVQ